MREGDQLASANPPSHRKTIDNGGHWSICFYISFFVLFFPHCAAGRCFTFSFACSVGPLSPHLFCHLPGQQFLLFMSLTQGGRGRQERKERERQRCNSKRQRGRGFFFSFSQRTKASFPLFFPPPFFRSFIRSFIPAKTSASSLSLQKASIRVQPTLTPPPLARLLLLLLLLAPLPLAATLNCAP